jgi:hypothetical protein
MAQAASGLDHQQLLNTTHIPEDAGEHAGALRGMLAHIPRRLGALDLLQSRLVLTTDRARRAAADTASQPRNSPGAGEVRWPSLLLGGRRENPRSQRPRAINTVLGEQRRRMGKMGRGARGLVPMHSAYRCARRSRTAARRRHHDSSSRKCCPFFTLGWEPERRWLTIAVVDARARALS